MDEYQTACFAFLDQEAHNPEALALLAASLKRVPVDDTNLLGKQLEEACIAQSHVLLLEQGVSLVKDLQSCTNPAGPHGATLAARLCARWTTGRGLRELTARSSLKNVLELCIIAERADKATPEQAAALLGHMEAHPEISDMELVAIALDVAVRLRPGNGCADVLGLLSAIVRHYGEGADALPCDAQAAALVLHRLWRLGVHDAHAAAVAGRGADAAAAAEPPLVRQLTWRVAADPWDMHPALLMRAMHASSQLLGFVFVPLMKAVVRRFANPASARVLSMEAVCTTLRVLRSAKQLASYNKSSGTILRNMAREGPDGGRTDTQHGAPAEVSEDAQRAARQAADSGTLAIPRQLLCDALCNVLAVLALHLQKQLPEAHLAALPPPPPSLRGRVQYLPTGMTNGASHASTDVWISTIFETVMLDNWVVGHVALGPELEWSQAATLRVLWKALAAESTAPASPAAPRTSAVMLQRLLYCHAQHRRAVPPAASSMVASLLVPQVHSLDAEQVSHTIWALGRLQLRHGGLVAALMQATRRHLSTLGVDQLAHVLGSLAALAVNDPWLVRSLGTSMLNHLHAGAPLRAALAVQTLKALADYKQCHPQLVAALHQRVLMPAAGGRAGRPRRLAAHHLADLAAAVGDLHTHCGPALAPVPHVVGLTSQAIAEAVSGGRTEFSVEDLDKIRRFCVAAGAREVLPDVMEQRKRRAEAAPEATPERQERRPHQSVASYLQSTRGQQVRRLHETMPTPGRPLGFEDDAAFHTAPAPPGAARPGRPAAAAAAEPARPSRRQPAAEAAQLVNGMVDTKTARPPAATLEPPAKPPAKPELARPAPPPASRAPLSGAAAHVSVGKAGPRSTRKWKESRRESDDEGSRDDTRLRAADYEQSEEQAGEFDRLMHSPVHDGKHAHLRSDTVEARAEAALPASRAPARPASTAAMRPANTAAARPASTAAVRPANTPAARPANTPAARPASRPPNFDAAGAAQEAMQQLARPRSQHAARITAPARMPQKSAQLKSRPEHHGVPSSDQVPQAAVDAAAADFSLRGPPAAPARAVRAVEARQSQHAEVPEVGLEEALFAPIGDGPSWLDQIKQRNRKKRNEQAGKTPSAQIQQGIAGMGQGKKAARVADVVDAVAKDEEQAGNVTAAAVEAAEKAAEQKVGGARPVSPLGKARVRPSDSRSRAAAVAAVFAAVDAVGAPPAAGVEVAAERGGVALTGSGESGSAESAGSAVASDGPHRVVRAPRVEGEVAEGAEAGVQSHPLNDVAAEEAHDAAAPATEEEVAAAQAVVAKAAATEAVAVALAEAEVAAAEMAVEAAAAARAGAIDACSASAVDEERVSKQAAAAERTAAAAASKKAASDVAAAGVAVAAAEQAAADAAVAEGAAAASAAAEAPVVTAAEAKAAEVAAAAVAQAEKAKAAAAKAAAEQAAAEAAAAKAVAAAAVAKEAAAAAAAKAEADKIAAAQAAAEQARADAAAQEETAAALAAERAAVAAAEQAAAERAEAEQATIERAAAEQAVAEQAAAEHAAAKQAAAEQAAAEQAAAEQAAAEQAAAEQAAAEQAAVQQAAAEQAAAEQAAAEQAAAEAAAARAEAVEEDMRVTAAQAAVSETDSEDGKRPVADATALVAAQSQAQAVECEVVTDEQYAQAQQRWADEEASGAARGAARGAAHGAMASHAEFAEVGDGEQGVWVDMEEMMLELAEDDPDMRAVLEHMAGAADADGELSEEAMQAMLLELMHEDGGEGAVASGGRGGGGDGGSSRGFGKAATRRRAVPRKRARRAAERVTDELLQEIREEEQRGAAAGGWEHPLPPGMNARHGR